MSDFTSDFWNWFIAGVTIVSFIWLIYLLISQSKVKGPKGGGQAEDMGHVWDEDLRELNTPLPKWWLNMFYITIVFGVVYLVLYPGLGTFAGVLGWTQESQYQEELADAKAEFGPVFERFTKTPLGQLAKDPAAQKAGARLYASYCAVCHGSDARGATGFPNLRDADWLYGSDGEAIRTSIGAGRDGVMPAWEGALGGAEGVDQVTAYLLTLSGRKPQGELANADVTQGQMKYGMFCAGCHLPDGSGNAALGAPNLADDVWLYGGSVRAIRESIAKGRAGRMPAHNEFLGTDKVHVLSAYVLSLSQK